MELKAEKENSRTKILHGTYVLFIPGRYTTPKKGANNTDHSNPYS